MARKAEDQLHKHTMNFFAGDIEKIADLYPDVGASVIIRRLVRDFVERVSAQNASAVVKTEVKL